MPLCAPTRGINSKAIRAPKPRAAAGVGRSPTGDTIPYS